MRHTLAVGARRPALWSGTRASHDRPRRPPARLTLPTMNPTTTKRALGVLAALAVLCFGLWWGGHPSALPSFLRSAFVANPHDVVIGEALSDIQRDYYRPVGEAGLINGAIAGAVASLGDPYAQYQTPHDYNRFTSPPSHPFAGVGITVEPRNGGLQVQEVI